MEKIVGFLRNPEFTIKKKADSLKFPIFKLKYANL
jgi:hypothetical protein